MLYHLGEKGVYSDPDDRTSHEAGASMKLVGLFGRVVTDYEVRTDAAILIGDGMI